MRVFIFISLFACLVINSFANTNFSGERLKASAIDYLKEIVGDDSEISISKSISDISFDEDKVQAEFTSEKSSLRGSCNLNVEFKLNGRILRHFSIPIYVKIFKLIPVAERNLSANSLIKSEDIVYQKYDVTNYSDSEFAFNSDLIGKSLNKAISKGRPITISALKKEYSILRGSVVPIIVQTGAIQVCAYGRAQNSGMPGDEIKVLRDGSGGLIVGIADSNGSVIVGVKK